MNRDRRWRLLLWVSLVAAVIAPVALAADAPIVSQRNRAFAPSQLQVARGSTVQIMNDDKVTHHIYVDAPTMKFDSGEQPVGKAVELRFDEAGTFDVLCAIHPTMHLQVNVK
jgi:plastocyanin